ncbi:MAG: hypothetical protein J1F03_02430 [Oscillospiraceae bacterium]|nr:hypothetical protein [Oscillospiraceae bacterium]
MKYDDIIKLPCPKPEKRMPMQGRAAQFLSFAALTGLDEAIDETAEKQRNRDISEDSEFDGYFLD